MSYIFYDHMCNNTSACMCNVTDNVHVNIVIFIEIMFILKAIQSHFKGLYAKQNLTLVVFFYKIYETCRRLIS